MDDDLNSYNFNQNDYEFIINIRNGVQDIFLKPEAWDDLVFEEDIFQWATTGSITIKSPFDIFERESNSAVDNLGDRNKLVYKFRNDGRDTLYITIMPKKNGEIASMLAEDFEEKYWRIELECVIYDVEDLNHGNYSNKMKKLYFWEKTYQMMLEKNSEFSTALVGSNKDKTDIHKLNNEDRGLPTGEAIGELLLNDDDFKKHAEGYANKIDWEMSDEETKTFFTSPANSRFIDDLNELKMLHMAGENAEFQPCIFKLERPEQKGKARQFSLMSIKDYFAKAGKDENNPGVYQIEHLFLEEGDEGNEIPAIIKKAPLSSGNSLSKDFKAEDHSKLKSFQLLDFSGIDNSAFLQNKFITSMNTKDGQFNIEIKEHASEKYQEFAEKNIYGQILTKEDKDRLPMTKFIKNGFNSEYIFSPQQKEKARLADGRNSMLKHYLFNNMGIAFTRKGLTLRQPARFFGISKQSQNDKEYDHKIEGQYFITNVVHHFSTSKRSYMNTVTAIKAHTYEEKTKFEEDDLIMIK